MLRNETMTKTPSILLINPWITDFAAFDLWAKPLGLLLLAALLRQAGIQVDFVDCLRRNDPLTLQNKDTIGGCNRPYGTGKYPRTLIDKPQVYADMPRNYYRYGIHPESLACKLESLPKPDLIWLTSIMTYWYPGVQQTIALIRQIFPHVPVWLGGIYARLCGHHASITSGADRVVVDPLAQLAEEVEAQTGFRLTNKPHWNALQSLPIPALDLLPELAYAPLLTSWGCRYSCPYCASRKLQPKWERRSADAIYREIVQWHQDYGIKDFAFYDDALLLDAESTLRPALERLCREDLEVRFHTPNALHVRALGREWCHLLHASGFTTMRLGLETGRSDQQKEWGDKVDTTMFFAAMQNLTAAGFSPRQIGVYLLAGLPGQSPQDVEDAITLVRSTGALPYLSEYSPVPGTAMWREVLATCQYDLAHEPLYHNNSFFACRREDFTREDLAQLKRLARQARQAVANARGAATARGARVDRS